MFHSLFSFREHRLIFDGQEAPKPDTKETKIKKNPESLMISGKEIGEKVDNILAVQRSADRRLTTAQAGLANANERTMQQTSDMLKDQVQSIRDAVSKGIKQLPGMIASLNDLLRAYMQESPDKDGAKKRADGFAKEISIQMKEKGSEESLRFDGIQFILVANAEATATATATNSATLNSNTNNANTNNNTVIIQPASPERAPRMSEAQDLALLKSEIARYESKLNQYAGRLNLQQQESLKLDWMATINTTLREKNSRWQVTAGPIGATWMSPYSVERGKEEIAPAFNTLNGKQYNFVVANMNRLKLQIDNGMNPGRKAAAIRSLNAQFGERGIDFTLQDDLPGSTLPRIIAATGQRTPVDVPPPRSYNNPRRREAPPSKPSYSA